MSATASQTIGPFWHGLAHPEWADLTRFADGHKNGHEGERITVAGIITDGLDQAVADACVEIWQADPAADATFPGFGRCATDAEGRFRFITYKPGATPTLPGGNSQQAPHLALTIFARGLLHHLNTRLYFEGEALNQSDPLLSTLPAADRATLIARHEGEGAWRLDIRLQGEGETVFLEI